MEPIAAARSGDERAFVDLVDGLLPLAHRLAYAMLRSPEDAEDAVQESTLKAWRAVGRLRDDSNPKAWFLTIVANECRQRRRNRWWSVIKGSELPEVSVPGPEQCLESVALREALGRLRPSVRLVLVLRYYLDLPFEEMGRILGTTATAAKLRTHRALKELRVEVPETLSDE